MKLQILVNLEVRRKRIPWPLKERITTENGVTTIRPLRNGVPGGTEKEVAASIAEFENAMRLSDRGCRRLITDLLSDIEVDLPAEVAAGWDANGSPA